MMQVDSFLPLSIDEAFLDLTGIANCMDLEEFGRVCTKKNYAVYRDASSCRIGPTKTLAKVASYGAKRYPTTQGVLDVTALHKRTKTHEANAGK